VPFSKRERFGTRRPGGLPRLDLARPLTPEVRMPPEEPIRRWEIETPRPEREDERR
jgi:hypothetical protein